MEGPGQGLPDTDKRNPPGSGAGVSLALPHKKGRRLPVSPATVYLTVNTLVCCCKLNVPVAIVLEEHTVASLLC